MINELKKTALFLALLTAVFVGTGCGDFRCVFDKDCCGDDLIKNRIAGFSVKGTAIDYSTYGCGDDTVLILGAIHGNEPASAMLTGELEKHLKKNQSLLADKRIVVIPVANPDGLAAGTRFNANGVDINRNFEADNRENNEKYGLSPLTEPESRALKSVITQYLPNRVVTIHQPVACIDYDGPAKSLAQAMAANCDLPVRKLGAMPGSLGSYSGLTLGIPIVTFELPEGSEQFSREMLWSKYGQALIAAIKFEMTSKSRKK